MILTKRQTATILAALRNLQTDMEFERHSSDNWLKEAFPEHFHGIKPLTDDEIDVLCQRINND